MTQETHEPKELPQNRVPVLVWWFVAILMMVMVIFLAQEWPMRHLPDGQARRVVPLPEDPIARGEVLFRRCAACHGENGRGKGSAYPPLLQSPYVLESKTQFVTILINGLTGPIEVHGKIYDGRMPSWGYMSDQDLAAIASYVRQAWGHEASAITTEEVAEIRAMLE